MLPLSDQFLADLLAPDRRAATRFCLAQLEAGMPLHELVDDVMAPAMEQVGQLWQSAVWSVVDEHIATGVVDAALSAAASFGTRDTRRGEIVVACAEGDWHSLPSRMVAEVLDSRGWSVRFLGASHPTGALTEYVRRHQPDAVFLSCAVPMALPNLMDAVDSLRGQSASVFVGGRALGPDARRSVAVGADGWAANAAGAAELLEGPLLEEGPQRPDALAAAQPRLGW
jgi:methanogenic corrinoid protein MtbC1